MKVVKKRAHHLFITIIFSSMLHGYKAFVGLPVIDLVGQPLSGTPAQIQQQYRAIPVCGGSLHPYESCKRIHQLLLHELVDVIQERGPQVKIAITQHYFITHSSQKPQHHFWTLKQYLIPYNEAEHTVAAPISFQRQSTQPQGVCTLLQPYRDATTGLHYSAGTRFVMTAAHTATHYGTMAYHPKKKKFVATQLPKEICFDDTGFSHQERIQKFVALLRSWAHLGDGFIPYVWGGRSFTHPYQHAAVEAFGTISRKTASWYRYPEQDRIPATGFDCSNLIAHATQMCGIPYFFKNSFTVAQRLRTITNDTPIAAGDIIWVAGHVMVVSDVEKALLIEARHYAHGYGKIQEIELRTVFKDLHTYEQLKTAMFTKKPLYRIDKEGAVRDTYADFKILKLDSVWH